MGKYGSDEQIKFFYKGKFLGACDAGDAWCPELLNLMKSDKEVAASILNYMNSLGNPVFPISEEDWGTPETNVDNVDIEDLYNTFLQELDYEYRDFPDDFYIGGDYLLPDFEIFVGPVAEENVVSSTKIKASRYDNVPGYKTPEGGYLYILKHGIGPGTLPSDVEIIKTKDLPNYYTAVWLSDFLTTDELKKYDIPSETRINELLGRIDYCQKNGDVVPCDEVEACGDITASTNDSGIVNKIYSVMMDYEYGYDPDMTDINAMLQELTNKGVHVDTSDAFKEAWVSAHNKAESKTWGDSGDSYHYDSLTPGELEAIENYDTEYWEYVKDHPLNLKPASITSSIGTKYLANMVSASIDEDGFEQLVDADEDDSTWKEPKYTARSYYGTNYSGLEDDFSTDDPSELVDWIWEHASRGGYIEVEGPKNRIRLNPDDLAERVEFGDIGEYDIISQIDYL